MPRSSPSPRTNVKARSTRFIGRELELSALRARLSTEALVSVLGAPGMGKTRLAHEYALRHAEAYPGGAWMCDLTYASDVDGICGAIGATLDVPLMAGSGAGMLAQLADAIAARGRVLVVLDNFEHLVAHAQATLPVLRERAPEARFLVTSRTRTDVEGEAILDLGPLPLPRGSADVADSEAVRLFVDRAGLVVHDYALTMDEAPRAAALVRELDGLPLALELAAARMRVFSTATLLEHLRRRFDVLVRGASSGGPRHGSLRDAIDASWRALDPWEQAVLAHCAVFRGSFDLDAAERVIDLGEGAPCVADVLQSLRDRSLLVRETPREGPGDARFTLYLSIRDYAWDRLRERGADEAAITRHAAYYEAEACFWSAKADGPEGALARRWLLAEKENLLAVHHRAFERIGPARAEDVRTAARVALALQPALTVHGPLSLAAALHDAVLGASGAAGLDADLRARALAARAEVHRLMGDYARAIADADEVRSLGAQIRDHDALVRALFTKTLVHLFQGRLLEAHAELERARGLIHPDDRRQKGRILTVLGVIRVFEGAQDEARESFLKALPLHREAGDIHFEGMAEGNLCITQIHFGRLEEAREHGERAVALHRALGNRRNLANCFSSLASIADELGRPDEAATYFEQSIRIAGEIGDRYTLGVVLGHQGSHLFMAQRLREARESCKRALASLRDQHSMEVAIHAWLGSVEATAGRVDAAREAFAEAERPSWARERPTNAAVIHYLRGHLDLALAREAAAGSDLVGAAEHVASAARRLAAAPLAPPRLEVTRARRSLEHALLTHGRASEDAALLVHPEGEWFRLPSGRRVDCSRRRLLGRLLVALTEQRLARPGAPMSVKDLVARGWPSERILSGAAVARLRVALSSLRKEGLGALLSSHPKGYLLDPKTPARFATHGE
ncbi:ATP-binding protein [Polyangium jinanense]|uniref:Tetratricopeptide repeat protein n=1 Tax=Polyangium jinanense TaxID=2829994 RepID=A0A9X3X6S0_9BACT|nr:tetratricopeptide repeat protein [Polyangium jinanense]MDC3984939.1 tetratricopeptide repeat protein [Polyangium jinanense]